MKNGGWIMTHEMSEGGMRWARWAYIHGRW